MPRGALVATIAQGLGTCVLAAGCAAGSIASEGAGSGDASTAPPSVDAAAEGATADDGGGQDSGVAPDATAPDDSASGSCPDGAPCPAPQVCHQGVVDCTTGMPVCTDHGPMPDGTSCGTGLYCVGGACAGNCSPGATQSCSVCGTTGTSTCTSGYVWGSCAPPAGMCSYVDQSCSATCDTIGKCWPHVDRSYDATNGFHFYTTNDAEASCCGYTVEDLDYYYLYAVPNAGLVPFYRCLLSNGSHLYTTSSSCEGAAGSTNEGSMGYIATSQVCGSTPLYRLTDAKGDHFYTTSSSEASSAEASGYTSEGVSGYVWSAPEK